MFTRCCSTSATALEKRRLKKRSGWGGVWKSSSATSESTHGILRGVSALLFHWSLSASPLRSRFFFPPLRTCASSQKLSKLSEFFSWNFSGNEVRSPSLVWLRAWNSNVCICIAFRGAYKRLGGVVCFHYVCVPRCCVSVPWKVSSSLCALTILWINF